ncbi:pectate lyase [Niabella terrae]
MIGDKDKMILPGRNRQRYAPTDIIPVAENILCYQKSNGGWPKNYDVFAVLTPQEKRTLQQHRDQLNTTFDNGTCYTHIRALAIAFQHSRDPRYRLAALEGLRYILKAQYANGGWPQYYPLRNDYSRYITYNDGGMEGIVAALGEIANRQQLYDFIEAPLRQEIIQAYQKGIECILKTQIKEDGRRTAWCQQHSEMDLAPTWARSFEPPSICNGESAGIVLFLMQLDHPDNAVIQAVQSAVRWFEDSKIYHTRVKTIAADTLVTDYLITTKDKVVVNDPQAPPVWTRYYELGSHRPLFCNRDSKFVYSLAEVARERRDGYAWYTYAPQKVLDRYPAWQRRWAPRDNVLVSKK